MDCKDYERQHRRWAKKFDADLARHAKMSARHAKRSAAFFADFWRRQAKIEALQDKTQKLLDEMDRDEARAKAQRKAAARAKSASSHHKRKKT